MTEATIDLVTFDLDGPDYRIGPIERDGLPKRDSLPALKAFITTLVIQTLVTMKHTTMDGRDSRIWGWFQDEFAAEPTRLTIPRVQYEWLMRVLNDDDIQTPAGFAHWRMSLMRYCDTLRRDA